MIKKEDRAKRVEQQQERMSDVIGNKVWDPVTMVAFDYSFFMLITAVVNRAAKYVFMVLQLQCNTTCFISWKNTSSKSYVVCIFTSFLVLNRFLFKNINNVAQVFNV